MKTQNRIKELRKKGYYSQSDLAKAVGVTRQAISKYEHGDRQPSFETVEIIASYFDVSPAYLIGWSDERGVDNENSKSD